MGEKSCLCWQCPHLKECDERYHRLKLRRKPRPEIEKPEWNDDFPKYLVKEVEKP